MLKLSNQQLEKLTLHTSGICNVLLEICTAEKEEQQANPDELLDLFFSDAPEEDKPIFDTLPKFVPTDYVGLDHFRREQAIGILCGRWVSGNVRCGIEISRAGEHFILTYLKRNGTPTDERYILMWLDGDILYYGHQDRMTMLALNTQSDTLMISPGVDYSRVTQDEIK
ncbi:hypothetical protein EZS27_006695 [termite gut metagenome]|uniref:DUF3876 domain-containing protein n=1 Tax=termite gut metagenome TaxID=433724 RepID=A0A5J4SI07_9ZZZZ